VGARITDRQSLSNKRLRIYKLNMQVINLQGRLTKESKDLTLCCLAKVTNLGLLGNRRKRLSTIKIGEPISITMSVELLHMTRVINQNNRRKVYLKESYNFNTTTVFLQQIQL
jgi:hypothetical protein